MKKRVEKGKEKSPAGGEKEKQEEQKTKEVERLQNEKPGRLSAQFIRSLPSFAHLTEGEAMELAEFLVVYCKAVFLWVDSRSSRGTPFEVEQYNKKAA
ncbi:MAG: hypothetical protein K1X81_11535 [Bacteroidia bacterium]|nr:hypothetical protein [Bacteroidia bacterium]